MDLSDHCRNEYWDLRMPIYNREGIWIQSEYRIQSEYFLPAIQERHDCSHWSLCTLGVHWFTAAVKADARAERGHHNSGNATTRSSTVHIGSKVNGARHSRQLIAFSNESQEVGNASGNLPESYLCVNVHRPQCSSVCTFCRRSTHFTILQSSGAWQWGRGLLWRRVLEKYDCWVSISSSAYTHYVPLFSSSHQHHEHTLESRRGRYVGRRIAMTRWHTFSCLACLVDFIERGFSCIRRLC